MMKAYIAGKITGDAEYREKFEHAKGFLKREGFTVLNPAELPEVRDLLKSNGFKWAPSQGAWQRQITSNGRYALGKVVEKLKEMEEAEQQ